MISKLVNYAFLAALILGTIKGTSSLYSKIYLDIERTMMGQYNVAQTTYDQTVAEN